MVQKPQLWPTPLALLYPCGGGWAPFSEPSARVPLRRGRGGPPHPQPTTTGPEVMQGNVWASPGIHLTQSHQVPYCVAQRLFSKPFLKICKGTKTATCVMACNDITPHGHQQHTQGTSSHTAYALENCATGAEQNLAQSLEGGGSEGGGPVVWNPPPHHTPPPLPSPPSGVRCWETKKVGNRFAV